MSILEQLTYNDPTYNEEQIEDIYKIIKDDMASVALKNKKNLIFKKEIKGVDIDEYLLQNLDSIAWAIDILRNNHYLTWWHEKTRGEKHSTFVKNLIYNIGLFMYNVQILKGMCSEKIRDTLDKLEQKVLVSYDQEFSPQALYNLTYGYELLSAGHHLSFFSSVFFIRVAIEKKLKMMLGIKDDDKSCSLSKMIGFLEKNHEKYFDLPQGIDFNKIRTINTWCNQTMIHNGIVPYLWTIWEAIETISPLFRTENNGAINLEGFMYRKDPNENLVKKVKKFKK